MALTPGTRFGAYEIADAIGAGGMGEVYRAHDQTLERDVAIKVLPPSFASDENRLARFEQEAKTLASLNHVNIAHIYGLERSEGTTALAMELVEGPTLAERIEQGPIPPDEALNIALQIADGLEAAHARGIVHRDLKPANIKLATDGTVKVLDFGIAKALDTRAISGPKARQLTTPAMTEAGIVLGTAQYMSPEQARGKQVDQRADIWAFGCVLYEMLTGQPAFGGEDVTMVLARVLERGANLDALPATIQPAVRQAISLCLQKDPKKRVRDIGDLKLVLEGAFETVSSHATGAVVAAQPLWRRALPIAATAVIAICGGALAIWVGMQPEPPQVARFDVTPADQTIMSVSPSVAVSPDGGSIAYLTGGVGSSGGDELRLRSLDSLESRVLLTQGPMGSPFFSPNGQEIGYYENVSPQTLKRVSIQGGSASSIATIGSAMRGASWGADGSIIFADSDPATGLWRVSALGGKPEALTTPAGGDHLFPEILPGGEVVLFTIVGVTEEESEIAALSLASGEQTIVQRGGSYPRYSPTGHLLFGRAGTLWAVAFDAETLATGGSPVPVQEGVMTKGGGATEISLAANGTLVYVAGGAAEAARGLIFVDADGDEQVVLQSGGVIDAVALSPDGTHAAIAAFTNAGLAQISIWDLTRPGSSLSLTRNFGFNHHPIFSPDGRRVAWGRSQNGTAELLVQNADGSGQVETLAVFDPSINRVIPTSWWRDDAGMALLAVTLIDNAGRRSIGVVTVGEPESFRPLGSAQFNQGDVAFAPDARWFAYASDEKGFYEVYVERFPDGGGRQAVSIGGGKLPKWSEDGQSLSYLKLASGSGPISIDRVALSGGTAPDEPLIVARPVELFSWRYYSAENSQSFFDMSPDGERFLVISWAVIGESADPARTILVQNWTEELKRLVPVE
jgi:Tol biopolymer transport system component